MFLAYALICFALMLDLVDENISRVSNLAYVESHNKIFIEEIQEHIKDKTFGDTIRTLKKYNDCLLAEEKIFKLRTDDDDVTIMKYVRMYTMFAQDPKKIWIKINQKGT